MLRISTYVPTHIHVHVHNKFSIGHVFVATRATILVLFKAINSIMKALKAV